MNRPIFYMITMMTFLGACSSQKNVPSPVLQKNHYETVNSYFEPVNSEKSLYSMESQKKDSMGLNLSDKKKAVNLNTLPTETSQPDSVSNAPVEDTLIQMIPASKNDSIVDWQVRPIQVQDDDASLLKGIYFTVSLLIMIVMPLLQLPES